MLTLKGTEKPIRQEIANKTRREVSGNKTDVIEIYATNSTAQKPVTSSFIYHDTYFYFDGLEEDTEYVLYFFMKDLSENILDV